jgi:DNA-binding HxlR family transcriptional regulator
MSRASGAASPRPGGKVRASSTGRPIMALLDLLGRRWAMRVLWELHQGSTAPTFRTLQAACGGISSSVLTSRLSELGAAGIVDRDENGYVLTPEGIKLVESLDGLNDWARRWADRLPPSPG